MKVAKARLWQLWQESIKSDAPIALGNRGDWFCALGFGPLARRVVTGDWERMR